MRKKIPTWDTPSNNQRVFCVFAFCLCSVVYTRAINIAPWVCTAFFQNRNTGHVDVDCLIWMCHLIDIQIQICECHFLWQLLDSFFFLLCTAHTHVARIAQPTEFEEPGSARILLLLSHIWFLFASFMIDTGVDGVDGVTLFILCTQSLHKWIGLAWHWFHWYCWFSFQPGTKEQTDPIV